MMTGSSWFTVPDADLWVRLTLTLLHFLWVGGGIALVAAGLAWCLRRASAQTRYLLHLGALSAMVAALPLTYALVPAPPRSGPAMVMVSPTPKERPAALPLAQPLPPAVAPLPPPPITGPAATLPEPPPAPAATTPLIEGAAPYVAGGYLLGVLIMVGRLAVGWWGGRRLRRMAVPVTDAGLLAMAGRQAHRLGLKALPVLAWCERTAVPIVVGLARPVILLPAALVSGLAPQHLEALLAHELAHVRRGDLLVNLFQRLAEAVLFFHPAAWYVSRCVSAERENACDDRVLAAGWPRLHYADALVSLAEQCLARQGAARPVALAATGERPSHFKRRVLRLLQAERPPRFRPTGGGVLVALLALAALAAGIGLYPVAAQTPPAQEEPPAAGPKDAPPGGAKQVEPLITATVVDADNGQPIPAFQVVPGTPYGGGRAAGEEALAVWQPHLLKAGTAGQYVWAKERSYDVFRLRFEAEGYVTGLSPWLSKAGGPRAITVKLRRDPGVSGRVLTPDGQPAAGAVLAVALPNRGIRLENGKVRGADEPPPADPVERWRRPLVFKADDQGRYRLPTDPGPAKIYAVHDAGILETAYPALKAGTDLRLNPWGGIDGRVVWIDRPGANETLSLIAVREVDDYPDACSLIASVTTDAQGRFRVDRLPPWPVQLAREFALPNGKGHYQFPYLHVTVAPGRPTAVVFGGPGRPVVGKLTGMDSYEGLTLSLAPRAPRPGDQDLWAGFQAVAKSDLGPVFHRNDLPVNKDGTFRIDRVLPENYQLFVRTKDNSVYHVQQLQVTAPPAGQPDQAQDVGTIQLKKRAAAAAEPPAANQVIDAQGRPIAGATIELQPYELEPKTVLARTTTDAQGHFTYPAETPAKDYFFVRVSAPGFRAERWLGNYVVHVRRDGKPVPDVFRLNRPVTLEGRVLGVGGKPLAGVPLAFDFVNDHMRSINHLQFNSDAEGRFRLEGLPAGDLYVRYSRTRDQADPAPPQAQLYIARVQATEGQTIRDVVVDLGQAVYHLEGQVVDAQGAGVADAHVTVGFAPWALDHTVHTTTDARGNFRVEGLQPHAFAVTASKGGVGLGEAVPVEVPPDRPAYVKLRAFTPGQPPPAARPALPWGPAHDGLQAVTVVEPQEADHAIGKVVQVRVLVRNAGDKPRQFTDTWAFNALFVTGPDGQPQRFDYSHFTGLPWGVTYRLEPGQEVLLKGSFSLALVGKGDSGRQAMFQATVAPATTYRLAVRIGQGYGDEEVKADAGKVKDRLVPGETVLKVR